MERDPKMELLCMVRPRGQMLPVAAAAADLGVEPSEVCALVRRLRRAGHPVQLLADPMTGGDAVMVKPWAFPRIEAAAESYWQEVHG